MVFHDFGSNFNLQQNGNHLNAPLMLITMVQIPALYLIPSPRHLAKYIQSTQHIWPNHVSSFKWKTHCVVVYEWDVRLVFIIFGIKINLQQNGQHWRLWSKWFKPPARR